MIGEHFLRSVRSGCHWGDVAYVAANEEDSADDRCVAAGGTKQSHGKLNAVLREAVLHGEPLNGKYAACATASVSYVKPTRHLRRVCPTQAELVLWKRFGDQADQDSSCWAAQASESQ
ncbi:hypothetical protein ACQPXM_11300 [Kribbella sp. CA-253562]|uniref:hypothetical protein n=1 Tax=Kribbella sp. CA-253562 TaxID=3239942 RepID=UPI003D8D6E86